MKQNRSFNTGTNIFGTYNVIIERVQSAQHIGESMYPARYFGRIEDLDGNTIKSLGEAGMTSPSIKKFIGKPLGENPRVSSGSISNRRDKKLSELNRAKDALEAVGMDVAVEEINTLIAEREAEIVAEQEAQRAEQEAQREAKKAAKKQEKAAVAAAKKELKKLQAAKKAMEAVGMDTTAIDEKIASLQ